MGGGGGRAGDKGYFKVFTPVQGSPSNRPVVIKAVSALVCEGRPSPKNLSGGLLLLLGEAG